MSEAKPGTVPQQNESQAGRLPGVVPEQNGSQAGRRARGVAFPQVGGIGAGRSRRRYRLVRHSLLLAGRSLTKTRRSPGC